MTRFMRSLAISSPAKLNLFLRVLGKRKDGYHELATLFHRISLRDTLNLRKQKEGIRLFCSHPKVPIENNLIVRGFHLLKAACPFSGGVTVRLRKKIPVGGGLGGGSSNAATFLIAMNRLFRLGLSQRKLLEIGKRLGADVPFFLSGARQALGRGRGDEIQTLPFKGRLWFLLFPSGRGISTAKVFAGFDTHSRRPRLTPILRDARIATSFSDNRNLIRSEPLFVNDLTESAERIRPSLRKTRETLSDLHLGICRMSGSGPTLFMLFPSRQIARRAFNEIRKRVRPVQPTLLCHSI